MENTKIMRGNDCRSNEREESDLNVTDDEASSALFYENGLKPPILGNFYRPPDIPNKYVEPTVLDTSLPFIPVYSHLRTHDLKPITKPSTPTVLSELRLKFLYRNEGESCKSSRVAPSTGRTTKGRSSSVTLKMRESEGNSI